MLQDKGNRRFVFSMLSVVILAICFCMVLTFYMQHKYDQALLQISGTILDQIHKTYPEAEEVIIKEIFQKKSNANITILEAYGIDQNTIGTVIHGTNLDQKYLFWMIFLFVIFISSICFIMFRYLKRQSYKIEEIDRYCRDIIEENASLDIRDNSESSFSKLKNTIYDVTVMLKEKNGMLEENKKQTEELIGDISHQLKTPLTSLTIMNDLLYLDLSEEKKIEFLDQMKKELNKMEWLIKVVLNMAKLDSKTLVLERKWISAREMLIKCMDHFGVLCEVTQSNINISCGNDVQVLCDEKWTIEAIDNMIKNAIEHQGKKVEIKVEENNLYTQIMIIDNGEGIRKEDIFHVFDRFYQINNQTSKGMGLGLAFAKSIILHQEGDIKVKSRVGTGTKFIIKFYKKIVSIAGK